MKNWKAYPRIAFDYVARPADRGQFGKNDPAAERAVKMLRRMPVPAVPADLAIRVRSRISRERARAFRPDLSWRIRNWMEPFMVPASAGLLTAVICFGTFVRIFEVPVQADSSDVPIQVRTAPRLRSVALLQSASTEDCVKAQILIDESGRVLDVRILKVKGDQRPESIRNLENVFLFAVFDPATTFGRPTAKTVTVKLRDGQIEGVSL